MPILGVDAGREIVSGLIEGAQRLFAGGARGSFCGFEQRLADPLLSLARQHRHQPQPASRHDDHADQGLVLIGAERLPPRVTTGATKQLFFRNRARPVVVARLQKNRLRVGEIRRDQRAKSRHGMRVVVVASQAIMR